jgi:importin-5
VDFGEIIGVLFKTHKDRCANVVQKLISSILPEIAKDQSKPKQKFLLFILDDMIEFLGPDYLGPIYPQIVQQICNYSNSKHAAIRQASVYGIGMVAQHGGNQFQPNAGICLNGIKAAIDFPMDHSTKEKKSKAN